MIINTSLDKEIFFQYQLNIVSYINRSFDLYICVTFIKIIINISHMQLPNTTGIVFQYQLPSFRS